MEEVDQPAAADIEISNSTVSARRCCSLITPARKPTSWSRSICRPASRFENTEPVDIGSEINYVFSPDRTRLAVASKGAGCAGACLRLFELPALKQVLQLELPAMKLAGDWVHQIAFDPRGERIALALVDQATARIAVVDLTKPLTGMLQVGQPACLPAKNRLHRRRRADHADWGCPSAGPSQSALDHPASPGAVVRRAHPGPGLAAGSARGQRRLFGPADHSKPEEIVYYEAGIAVDAASQRIYIAHADRRTANHGGLQGAHQHDHHHSGKTGAARAGGRVRPFDRRSSRPCQGRQYVRPRSVAFSRRTDAVCRRAANPPVEGERCRGIEHRILRPGRLGHPKRA